MKDGRRDYVEGFRITRLGDSLIIEATDYHAQPLRLAEDDLAELGLRFARRTEPRRGAGLEEERHERLRRVTAQGPGLATPGPTAKQSQLRGGSHHGPEQEAHSPRGGRLVLKILPCLDSAEMAQSRKRELFIPREKAAKLGWSAVVATTRNDSELVRLTAAARAGKVSVSPDETLTQPDRAPFPETRVQVTNETTLGAARRLVDWGLRPVALNFANGICPGGGFLGGARAQEEVLCRSSGLHATLDRDPMYAAHAKRPRPDSTDWAICCGSGFTGFSPSRGPSTTRRSCWAPGAVAPSATIRSAPRRTSGRHWKGNSTARSPTSSSPSPTGRTKDGRSGRFGMCFRRSTAT